MSKISGIFFSPPLLALVILFGLLFLQSAFYFIGLPWGRPATLTFYSISALWTLGCGWTRRQTWQRFNKIDACFGAFVFLIAVSLGASNLTSEVDPRLWAFLFFMVVVPYICGRSLDLTVDLHQLQAFILIAGLTVMPMMLVDRLMTPAMDGGRFPFFGMNHSPLMIGALLAASLTALHSYVLYLEITELERSHLIKIAGYTLLCLTTVFLAWVSARGWLLAGIFGSLTMTVIAKQVTFSKRIILLLGIILTAALSIKVIPNIDSKFGGVYSAAANSLTADSHFHLREATPVLAADTPVLAADTPVLGSSSCMPFIKGTHSLSMRWVMYQEAIAIFLQKPLIGVGAGLFGSYSCVGYGGFPHSTILQILSELGVIGGVIFIAILALTVASLVEKLRDADGTSDTRLIVFIVPLFFCIFTADQIYGNIFASVAFWLLIGIFASMRVEPAPILSSPSSAPLVNRTSGH